MTSVADARRAAFCTQPVHLTGVVVTAVNTPAINSGGDARMSFWVADPSAPINGISVFKNYTDLPTSTVVTVGDVLTVDGFVGLAPNFLDGDGYRVQVQASCTGSSPAVPLSLVVTSHRAPLPDHAVTGGFGVAPDGGRYLTNADLAGSRIHLSGPLTLTNAFPTEMHRVSAVPGDALYYGFEVRGPNVPLGVLVRNAKTFGPARCDFRQMVADGGRTVTFPAGIRGVWDTYTNAPCVDGGIDANCVRTAGSIPGAVGVAYTYVLFPQDCTTDFASADAGP